MLPRLRFSKLDAAAAILSLVVCVSPARVHAGVTAAEASALQHELTPVGAERAGNAAGTIPPWTGGYTRAPTGYRSGDPRPDPFADDARLFQITAATAADYAQDLPEGALALFRKFPDYRIDVYPTRRSAAAPQAVYDAIGRNALNARPAPEGLSAGVSGVSGGIPFPIPKNGLEVVWNHLLAFWGAAREAQLSTYVVTKAGVDLTATYREIADFPYYYPGAAADAFGPYYFKTSHRELAPATKFGEAYLAWQPIDIARTKFAAWRYLPGERRVRRGPSLSYDTPDPEAEGAITLDEYYMFFGGPDRYDWKLVGKRELLIPYNNNRLPLRPLKDVLGPTHVNPDALRYERHRVWVVEGTLAPGKHHVAPRRRFYVDEDTWFIVWAESWDEDGRLWKVAQASMYLMPDVPAVVLGGQFIYDLVSDAYVYAFAFNEAPVHFRLTAPHPAASLNPEALAIEATR